MFRFGECELDVRRRELRRNAEPVHLEPQAFDLLTYLVAHRDRVVPKRELLEGVWGHAFLTEANLTTRIKEARRAVGDDGSRQHVIRNVRGHGYRFVADVRGAGDSIETDRRVPLVGRDADAVAVRGLLVGAPVVTLTGAGGVGKSALARWVADGAGASRTDGTYTVDLSRLEDAGDVLAAVTHSLHLVMEGSRPDDTVRGVARCDALILLDNCEHVIDEVAFLVEQLLGVPGSRVGLLATSRVPVGVSGEAVFAVGPLEVHDARALFVERATAATSTWRPSEDDSLDESLIDRLVTRLDRLPLMIEMAAARLGSMTLDELDAGIRTGASLRQITHRSPTSRHRSVASVVDWSVSLLEAEQQRLFAGLSVFAGRASASDIAAVLAPQEPSGVRFGLAALAERSLLVSESRGVETEYSMLRTVRAVAEHLLEEQGSAHATQHRHAEHVREVLGQVDDLVRTPRELEGRVRLDGLVDEVRAAHRWARSADPGLAADLSGSLFHAAHSALWSEPAAWAGRLVDRHDADRERALDGALVACAGVAAHRGELALSKTYARPVAARATGRLRASALELLVDVALYEGELDEAAAMADDLRRLGEELGDAHVIALAAADRSLASTYAGNPDAGIASLDDEVEELAPTDAAWIAYARAEALSAAGDDGAAGSYRAAIEHGSAVGAHFVVAAGLTSLAVEQARTGDVPAAFDTYAEALSTFLRLGNHTHAVTAIRNLTGLLADVGEDRGAVLLASVAGLDAIRPSYGAEAQRTRQTLDRVRTRVGEGRFSAWSEESRRLDIDQAVRFASRLVEQQRA